MATKKTAEQAEKETMTDESKAAETAAEKTAAPEQPADEWAEEVEVFVPRKPKGDNPQYYVCVNDRRFAFPADGRRQKMPKPIAEILQSSLDAEYAADEYAEQMSRHANERAAGL